MRYREHVAAPAEERPAGLAVMPRPPTAPPDLLPRPRVTDALRVGLERPLTVIRAPAGSGKTTALACALADSRRPVAWLALDEGHDDLQAFHLQVTAAVRAHFPDACAGALGLLQLPALPAPAVLGRTLGQDLEALPAELVLVLDDYHLIEQPGVHELLTALLRRPPTPLHLVLIARGDPPLPLARLRGNEQLAEFDLAHLRFQPEETRAFLEGAVGASISAADAAAVHTRMDGWAVGLRLAAIALRDWAHSPALLPGAAERADHYAEAFLWEEVVTRQPPDVQEFLLRTALADRFCATLADALMEWDGTTTESPRILAHLEQLGLFVRVLDEQRDWYRYHDLFRDALRHHLQLRYSPAAIETLHARASAWFAAHDRVDEAIRHALAASDAAGAARIVERQASPIERTDWQSVEQWLRLLPPGQVERRPALLIATAWIAYFHYAVPRLPALLRAAEALLDHDAAGLPADDAEILRAEIAVLDALVCIVRGDGPGAVALARGPWERLPLSRAHLVAQAGTFLGIGLQMSGLADAALALLHSPRTGELEAFPGARARLLTSVIYGQFAAANLRAAESFARQGARLAEQSGMQTPATWVYYWLGRTYYEWNELDAARQQFAAVIERRDQAHFFALRGSLQGLALTHLALGEAGEANALADTALELAAAVGTAEADIAWAFRGHLALLQGDLAAVARWLPAADSAAVYQLPFALEVPAITRVRGLLARGTEDALQVARDSLTDLLAVYEAHHDTLRVIELLALQGLVCRARGEIEQALAAVGRAVELAAPGGLVRTFVDLGPPMAALLVQLAPHGDLRDYVGQLLAAFGTTPSPAVSVLPDRDAALVLVEPLTEREIEVLRLMANRLSNKEIAAKLNISWQTAGKHAGNIYQKLQVPGRRAAVERARRLGLLAAD